jgi:hypothetical protein
MQDIEAQEILLQILRQAEEGKSIEFRLIASWAEFKKYWRDYRSTKLIIRVLKESADGLFKHYCKEVATGPADFTELLAYSELLDVKAFYERDRDTLKKMLDEYDDYLGKGHFWYSFLGGERETWQH